MRFPVNSKIVSHVHGISLKTKEPSAIICKLQHSYWLWRILKRLPRCSGIRGSKKRLARGKNRVFSDKREDRQKCGGATCELYPSLHGWYRINLLLHLC